MVIFVPSTVWVTEAGSLALTWAEPGVTLHRASSASAAAA